jgi:acetyl-CoA carboxylase carboxyltransferase component
MPRRHVQAGTRGHIAGIKVTRIRELALQHKRPYIALMEAGAGRFQENNGAFSAGIGERFEQHFNMSGRVPQVAAIMGACFGGPSFGAAQSDFVPIVRGTGFLGMSDPRSSGRIGRSSRRRTGRRRKGVDHFGPGRSRCSDDADCLRAIRKWLSYFLPIAMSCRPPARSPRLTPTGSRQFQIVSENHRRATTWRSCSLLVDEDSMFAYRPAFGPN